MTLPLIVFLSCAQANTLISRVISNEMSKQIKIEIIREIKSVSPKNCEWRY